MIREINPGWDHFDRYTFSPAVVSDDGWLWVSGMLASGRSGEILHPGDIAGQTDVILQRLGKILHEAGADYRDVVATREYVTTKEGYAATADVRRKYFSAPFPAATGVVVAGLVHDGALIEIEAVARVASAADVTTPRVMR